MLTLLAKTEDAGVLEDLLNSDEVWSVLQKWVVGDQKEFENETVDLYANMVKFLNKLPWNLPRLKKSKMAKWLKWLVKYDKFRNEGKGI